MRPGLREEIWRATRIFVVASLFGWGMNSFLEFILFASLLYLIWSFRRAVKIFQWVDDGMRGIPPSVSGIWGDISDTLNRQKRRHKKAQEKLSSAVRRISEVVESIDDGIIILNSDRTVDSWNKAATKFLGLRKNDRGVPILNLIRDPDFVAYLSSPESREPIEIVLPNNIEKKLQISAPLIGKEDIVVVITDITKFSTIDRIKSEFVSNVSHELRTPLTVFRGYLESFEDKADKSSLEKLAISHMLKQVHRMESLANDLTTLSSMEEAGSKVLPEKFKLNELVTEIVSEAKKLGNKQHIFTLDLVSCDFVGDLNGVRAALGNIIFNAVRHNPEGVNVNISLDKEGAGFLVSVSDDGVGLDRDDISRLTERFFRGDRSRNFGTGGSGLGLAIAKHAINRSQGTLEIQGNLGEGALFKVWLPNQS